LRAGQWPLSHPWPAVSLVSMALLNLWLPRPARGQRGTIHYMMSQALALTAAVLWLFGVLLR
jgi:hypothetical protein